MSNKSQEKEQTTYIYNKFFSGSTRQNVTAMYVVDWRDLLRSCMFLYRLLSENRTLSFLQPIDRLTDQLISLFII